MKIALNFHHLSIPALLAACLLLPILLFAQQNNAEPDNTTTPEEEQQPANPSLRLEDLMADDYQQTPTLSIPSSQYPPTTQPPEITNEPTPEPPEWENRIIATTTLHADNLTDDSNSIPIQIAPPEDSQASHTDGKIRLYMPYPPRTIDNLPPGWRLDAREDVPASTHKITLANGETIMLSVSPFVLVPINMTGAISLREPRSATTNTRLSDNLLHQAEALRNTNKQLQEALEILHQNLLSFPATQR